MLCTQAVLANDTPMVPNMGEHLVLTKNLSFGQTDREVRLVQEYLIKRNFLAGSATGYYGQKTRAAVLKWQAGLGIVSDGSSIGPKTRAAIAKDLPAPAPKVPSSESLTPVTPVAIVAQSTEQPCRITDFHAELPTIDFGKMDALVWHTTGCGSVSVDGGGTAGGNLVASGDSLTTLPAYESTTYTLHAYGWGPPDSRLVTITLNPSMDASLPLIDRVDIGYKGPCSIDAFISHDRLSIFKVLYGTDPSSLSQGTRYSDDRGWFSSFGSGVSVIPVSFARPNTLYYLKAVGKNAAGETEGAVTTFTTGAGCLPPK